MGRAPVVSLDFYGLQNVLGRREHESVVNEDFTGLADRTSAVTHTRKDFWPPPTVVGAGASTDLPMAFQGRDTRRSIAGSHNRLSLFAPKGKSGPSAEVKSDELREDQVCGKASASSERTPLNKPLEELTEDDIKQLTREDCRRYLKEKGMRRPSWNKSQAIQQVLSLKGLIDSKGIEGKRTDHAQGVFVESMSPVEHMQQTLPTQSQQRAAANVQQTLSSHAQDLRSSIQQAFPSHNENSLKGRGSTMPSFTRPSRSLRASSVPSDSVTPMVNQQQIKWEPPGMGKTQQVSALRSCIPNTVEKPLKAQLTIFYSGMVNVYDDVPVDKAQTIMLLAGTSTSLPLSFSPFSPSVAVNASFGTATSTPSTCLAALPARNHASGSVASASSSVIFSGAKQQTTTAMQSEAPPYRKACLQRFLEKRKERFRSKATPYPSSKKPSSYVLPQLYGVPIKLCETTSIPTVPQLLPPLVRRQRPTQSSGSETSSPTKPPETPQQASSDDQGTSVENRTSDS